MNVTNTNNYLNGTRIIAKFMDTLEAVAVADGAPNTDIDDDTVPERSEVRGHHASSQHVGKRRFSEQHRQLGQ